MFVRLHQEFNTQKSHPSVIMVVRTEYEKIKSTHAAITDVDQPVNTSEKASNTVIVHDDDRAEYIAKKKRREQALLESRRRRRNEDLINSQDYINSLWKDRYEILEKLKAANKVLEAARYTHSNLYGGGKALWTAGEKTYNSLYESVVDADPLRFTETLLGVIPDTIERVQNAIGPSSEAWRRARDPMFARNPTNPLEQVVGGYHNNLPRNAELQQTIGTDLTMIRDVDTDLGLMRFSIQQFNKYLPEGAKIPELTEGEVAALARSADYFVWTKQVRLRELVKASVHRLAVRNQELGEAVGAEDVPAKADEIFRQVEDYIPERLQLPTFERILAKVSDTADYLGIPRENVLRQFVGSLAFDDTGVSASTQRAVNQTARDKEWAEKLAKDMYEELAKQNKNAEEWNKLLNEAIDHHVSIDPHNEAYVRVREGEDAEWDAQDALEEGEFEINRPGLNENLIEDHVSIANPNTRTYEYNNEMNPSWYKAYQNAYETALRTGELPSWMNSDLGNAYSTNAEHPSWAVAEDAAHRAYDLSGGTPNWLPNTGPAYSVGGPGTWTSDGDTTPKWSDNIPEATGNTAWAETNNPNPNPNAATDWAGQPQQPAYSTEGMGFTPQTPEPASTAQEIANAVANANHAADTAAAAASAEAAGASSTGIWSAVKAGTNNVIQSLDNNPNFVKTVKYGGKAGAGVGGALTVAGIALSAVDIVSTEVAYSKGEISLKERTKDHMHTAASFVGGVAAGSAATAVVAGALGWAAGGGTFVACSVATAGFGAAGPCEIASTAVGAGVSAIATAAGIGAGFASAIGFGAASDSLADWVMGEDSNYDPTLTSDPSTDPDSDGFLITPDEPSLAQMSPSQRAAYESQQTATAIQQVTTSNVVRGTGGAITVDDNGTPRHVPLLYNPNHEVGLIGQTNLLGAALGMTHIRGVSSSAWRNQGPQVAGQNNAGPGGTIRL